MIGAAGAGNAHLVEVVFGVGDFAAGAGGADAVLMARGEGEEECEECEGVQGVRGQMFFLHGGDGVFLV